MYQWACVCKTKESSEGRQGRAALTYVQGAGILPSCPPPILESLPIRLTILRTIPHLRHPERRNLRVSYEQGGISEQNLLKNLWPDPLPAHTKV